MNLQPDAQLAEFLRVEASRPFCWGTTDCCSTANRWIAERVGVAPLAFDAWDGTEAAAAPVVARARRFAGRVARAMRQAGLTKTISPRPGDVGLVVWQGRLLLAIHAGPHWIARHADGFVAAPIWALWKAWRV